jgi:hypothetical protein
MTITGSADKMESKKEKAGQRRDRLLLKLLQTPPQPRPKRKRAEKKRVEGT